MMIRVTAAKETIRLQFDDIALKHTLLVCTYYPCYFKYRCAPQMIDTCSSTNTALDFLVFSSANFASKKTSVTLFQYVTIFSNFEK